MDFYNVLNELLTVPAISGFERALAEHLTKKISAFSFPVRRDALENLWTTIGRGRPRVVLFAHLDEIGFVITKLHKDGSATARCIGNWDPCVYSGVPVCADGIDGPVSGVSQPIRFETGDAMRIDFGFDSADALRRTGIRPLQQVWMKREPLMRFRNRLVSRALDNRLGCVLLLELLSRIYTGDLHFTVGELVLVWASQEEVGFRGTRAFARTVDPSSIDAVISIDAFPARHTPGVDSGGGQPVLGMGPVLRGADYEGVGTLSVTNNLETIAAGNGVNLQRTFARGHNQASVMSGVPWGALDFAMSGLHSGVEMVDQRDVEQMRTFLAGIVSQLNRFQR